MELLNKYFKLKENNSSIKTEVVAGFTTFVTMAYIIIVNPKILEVAGIPFGPSMVATILSAFFGTFLMGVYANRPFAIAPYMGENAFIAYTVVKVLGYSWQSALGAIFISGVLFTILTVFKIRTWLANSIPEALKIGFAVGIGLFLSFIGLNVTGIVKIGVPDAPVHIGNFHDPAILLAIIGFLLIGFLMIRKVNGAIIIGIIVVTILSFIFTDVRLPEKWVDLPPSLGPILFKLDILAALSWGFFSVILTVFVMDFVDTMGTLIGVSYRANLLDENGNLPEIEKPMLCDSLATVIGALLGTSTSGTFIESATGIETGGRTGLTSVVTALLFLIALFFAPFVSVIPACAYGPALIIVGMLMLSPITKIDFNDLTEAIPVFTIILLMSFTYNIGIGMTASFIVYAVVKSAAGRIKEIPAGLWVLSGFSLLFFVFYPY